MLTTTAQLAAPFVAPALAAGGAAMVTIPIAIHLLSRWRRRPQPFGAMRFLIEAYRRQKRRMRFEQWLLLLVRCLIVLLLGLALSRPMMVGWVGSLFGHFDHGGRVVNLVIDDSLSLQARTPSGETRFKQQIQSALSVLDALEPSDQVMVYRAGRPATPVTAGPTTDHAAVRKLLTDLRPGFARSDLQNALVDLDHALNTPAFAAKERVTFLFSDFPGSADIFQESPFPGGNAADSRNRLIVTRPALQADNLQIASFTPTRRVIWIDDWINNSIALQARLIRYTDAQTPAASTLEVGVLDASGKQLATTQQRITFAQGQRDFTASVNIPLGADEIRLADTGDTLLTLRARLMDTPNDQLSADNQAWAVVEIKKRMRVALVGDASAPDAGSSQGPSPAQWLSLALDPPSLAASATIETTRLSPAQLDTSENLNTPDAVMLFRPDRLSPAAWENLGKYTRAGGIVWVFVPPDQTASTWPNQLAESFSPGWRVGLEPVRIDQPETGLNVVTEPTHVEALERLAADWQALVKPIRVTRYLPVFTTPSDAWLTLAGAPDSPAGTQSNAASSPALLAHHKVGDGSLLLLTSAVDPSWTNLPTKPLFVPLVHETLLGLLGTRNQPNVITAVAGDQPRLNPAWQGTTELKSIDTLDDADTSNTSQPPPGIQVTDDQLVFDNPLRKPGVYQAQADSGPCRLIVNHDPKAADTRPIDEATLTHWLDGLGPWQWLDTENPAEALKQNQKIGDIGWPLLWIVLALVLIETWLARRFSYAGVYHGESLSAQVLHTVFRFRTGQSEARGRKGNA